MKKQAKTYLLLGFVLVIWGIIGFKVVGTLSPKLNPVVVSEPIFKTTKPVKKRDTFSLIADYRDPFLGTLPTPKKPSKPIAKKKPVVKRMIVYSGSVSQSSSGNTLYFVSIDGKQHVMSPKEEVDNVKLLGGNAGHIKVRYNGIVETIALTE